VSQIWLAWHSALGLDLANAMIGSDSCGILYHTCYECCRENVKPARVGRWNIRLLAGYVDCFV